MFQQNISGFQLLNKTDFITIHLNIIQLLSMMEGKTKENATFLLPMNALVENRIRNDGLLLHNTFWVDGNKTEAVHVALSSHYLALCQRSSEDYNYLSYVQIDFDLKFEVFYDSQGTPITGFDIMLFTPIGFRLFKGNSFLVELEITSTDLLAIWLKNLNKRVNQIGFHEIIRPLSRLSFRAQNRRIYKCQRMSDGKMFLVQVVNKRKTLNSQKMSYRQALINEVNMLKQLKSSNFLQVQGIFETDSSLYILHDFVDYIPLFQLCKKRNGHFLWSETVKIMRGIAKILKELHQKRIAHRNVKLETILIKNELETAIFDFGLAVNVDDEEYLFYRSGTPGYAAPQIVNMSVKQKKKLSPVCDVFSAGVIFHYLLTRKALFAGENVTQVMQKNKQMKFDPSQLIYEGVHPDAMDLLQKMLKVNPEQRITAGQMLQHPFLLSQMIPEQMINENGEYVNLLSYCRAVPMQQAKKFDF